MKRLLAALAVFPALLVGVACGDDGNLGSSGAGIEVVATTTQIGALVREVAGEEVELTVLLKAGADAHDYDPSPQAVKKVDEARLVLRNGLGLDDWLDGMIEGTKAARVVTVTEGVELREEGGGEGSHGADPHVWHNPMNAKVMVDNIVAALGEADPAKASTFRENGQAYKAVLDQTDAEIQRLIDEIPVANRKVVTNHDAFGYFLDRYGLEFVGAVIPTSNKEAQTSAKQLADLLDLVKSSGVKAVFAEEEVDPKVARELADDAGVKIVDGLYADSLGPAGSGADTVHGMLLANARKFSEALK